MKEEANKLLEKSSNLRENLTQITGKFEGVPLAAQLDSRNKELTKQNDQLHKQSEFLTSEAQILSNSIDDAFRKLHNVEKSIESRISFFKEFFI